LELGVANIIRLVLFCNRPILLQRFHHSSASARCDTALRATSSSGVKSSYLNQMLLPPGGGST